MPPDRDVAAFGRRAADYESGRRGRLHREISDRVADLAAAGLRDIRWQHCYALIIRSVTAVR